MKNVLRRPPNDSVCYKELEAGTKEVAGTRHAYFYYPDIFIRSLYNSNCNKETETIYEEKNHPTCYLLG